MIHLSFDTSTDILSLALFKEASIFDEYHVAHPRQHASLLVPKILELFGRTPYSLKDVSSLSVGIGPGSFTGSRIACSAAQGFSLAGNIPVCGVSFFQAMGAYAFAQLPVREDIKFLIVFEDSSQKDIYGQQLTQNLIPLEGEQGEPFYLSKQEFLERQNKFVDGISIICGSEKLLDVLQLPVSCLKVALNTFWERPAYWIGHAAFLLQKQKKCTEAFPLYVRPSYVDPSFKKTTP